MCQINWFPLLFGPGGGAPEAPAPLPACLVAACAVFGAQGADSERARLLSASKSLTVTVCAGRVFAGPASAPLAGDGRL